MGQVYKNYIPIFSLYGTLSGYCIIIWGIIKVRKTQQLFD